MRLSRFSLFVAAAVALWGHEVSAQSSEDRVPGTECCGAILIPVAARTISLGQALTARAGAEGVFFNPAGLIDVDDDYFFAHRSTAVDAQLNTFSLLIHSKVAGVFALTYRLIDFGETDVTQGPDVPTGTLSLIDQLLTASFATRITANWSAGISYKLYDFRSTCSGFCGGEGVFSGTTHLLDAGTQFRPPGIKNLVVGASLMHSGLALQIKNAAQADPTPARLRLGASYEVGQHFVKDSVVAVWLYGDVVQRIRDVGKPAVNVGVEVALNETIFIRAGHASSADGITLGGAGIGVGLKYQRFDVGVAKTFATSLQDPEGEPVHISFGVSF